MKFGTNRYKYLKQIGGRGRYGEVEIEINSINSNSIVTDDCNWKTMKQANPDFKELEILKIWKQSAIEAAQYLIDNYCLPESIEIKIKDVVGIYVDTVPVHLGAAIIIGIFDLINKPLKSEDIDRIDDFVTHNSEIRLIPDYKRISITAPKKYTD